MIAYHMQCRHYYEIRREEFVKGCESLGVDSLKGWQGVLGTIRTQLQDKKTFKKMFNFLFTYAEDGGENKKNVSVETACQYLDCVFLTE